MKHEPTKAAGTSIIPRPKGITTIPMIPTSTWFSLSYKPLADVAAAAPIGPIIYYKNYEGKYSYLMDQGSIGSIVIENVSESEIQDFKSLHGLTLTLLETVKFEFKEKIY